MQWHTKSHLRPFSKLLPKNCWLRLAQDTSWCCEQRRVWAERQFCEGCIPRPAELFAAVRPFMDILASRQPAAIEEAFLQTIEEALASHDLVIVDDLHLVTSVVESCNYARSYMLDAALTAIMGEAGARNKKLVFGVDEGDAPWPVRRRAYSCEIGAFTPVDYECICRAYLEEDAADRLDYARIHRFAAALNAHQLKNACVWLARSADLQSDRFIDYLSSQNMASNVDTKRFLRSSGRISRASMS